MYMNTMLINKLCVGVALLRGLLFCVGHAEAQTHFDVNDVAFLHLRQIRMR